MKLNKIVESKNFEGKVICGFPGVGKSTLFKELKNSGNMVLDSDSSKFDKAKFPQNYIEHIKQSLSDGYTILVSSHDVVRDALIDAGISFTLVYPDVSLKEEYMQRYQDRGSPESFIKMLDKNWHKWIAECDNLNHRLVTKIKLNDGEFLNIDKII